jgi:hypothetical protein
MSKVQESRDLELTSHQSTTEPKKRDMPFLERWLSIFEIMSPGFVTNYRRRILLPDFGQVLSPGFVRVCQLCFGWAAGRFPTEPLARRRSFRNIFTSCVTKCSIAVGQEFVWHLGYSHDHDSLSSEGFLWMVRYLAIISLALRPHDVHVLYILTHEAELTLTGYLDVPLTECFNYFANSFTAR